MRTLKFGFEKPLFIWGLICVIYAAVFWTASRHLPATSAESAVLEVIQKFAESSFPPKIGLVRELPDWSHLGSYALWRRAQYFLGENLVSLRAVSLCVMFLVFFVFVSLGYRVTYRNRLNPLWISFALLIFAANPYAWFAATTVGHSAILLFCLLAAMYFFEIEYFGWASIFVSLATLADWRGLLLAVVFLITRITGEYTRVLRAERIVASLLPFVVSAALLAAWNGFVPQGEARDWWDLYVSKKKFFRLDGLFYMLALVPLYTIWFSWSWGIRARSRSLVIGAIASALCIPIYFIFPIGFDYWNEIKNGSEVPLGLLDQGALLLAGPYKNLVLFVPWLAGTFIASQLFLMDILDRSRWLRYFVALFFLIQPFVLGVGDEAFLMVLPPILLLSLSEALVGEEGKIA